MFDVVQHGAVKKGVDAVLEQFGKIDILVNNAGIQRRAPMTGAFPATSTPAGLKIHKRCSLGRGNIVGYDIAPARDHDAPDPRRATAEPGAALLSAAQRSVNSTCVKL